LIKRETAKMSAALTLQEKYDTKLCRWPNKADWS